MKSTVTIYDSHWAALDAVKKLKNRNCPVNQLSILGRAKIISNHITIKSKVSLKKPGESVGVILGSTLGILPRVGVFAVPGYGLLLGAGAIKQVFDAYDVGKGLIEIYPILATIGIEKDNIIKCSEYLKKGKYLVIAPGNIEEVENAKITLYKNVKLAEFSINK
jgi:hypothetical protein